MKLGKNPARHTAKLSLRDYLTMDKLPTPPDNYGHETLVADWQMLGNDQVGDCAVAGPYHAIMLWNAEAQKAVNVNTDTAVKTYSAISGYDPATGANDNGCNVEDVAEYWRTQGLTDADGNVHKIDAYVALEPRNVEELWVATYLFDGVGIGVELPQEWMEAFQAGQAWDAISTPTVEGGHYILGVGRRAGMLNVVTWGKTQLMTAAGYEEFNDEAFAYFSSEKLINGVDIDGFNRDQLLADLKDLEGEALTTVPTPEVPQINEVEEAEESFAKDHLIFPFG